MKLEQLKTDIAIFKAINKIKTNKDFAAFVGIGEQTLSQILRGVAKVGPIVWMKLEKATKGEINEEKYQ